MQTIYFGKNRHNQWKASLDLNKISRFSDLQKCNVETVHNNRVYIVEAYLGFDYGVVGMHSVTSHSKLYHSVREAKKSALWQNALAEYKKNPSGYITNDFMIASVNDFGDPFTYGDVMEGKFNIKIVPVRVI